MSGRPKEFDPQEALATATGLFWSEGFQRTGMDDLVREMGISRQSAYDTFGGKRELFLAALRAYVDSAMGDVRRLWSDANQPALTRVDGFLEHVIRITTSGSVRGCLLTNAIVELGPHDPEVRKIGREALEKLEESLTRLLTEARQAGQIAATHQPRAMARLIVLTFEGALVVSKADRAETIGQGLGLIRDLLRA